MGTLVVLAGVAAFAAISALVVGWAIFVSTAGSWARVVTGFAVTVSGLAVLGISTALLSQVPAYVTLAIFVLAGLMLAVMGPRLDLPDGVHNLIGDIPAGIAILLTLLGLLCAATFAYALVGLFFFVPASLVATLTILADPPRSRLPVGHSVFVLVPGYWVLCVVFVLGFFAPGVQALFIVGCVALGAWTIRCALRAILEG